MFQESFMGISRKIEGGFKVVLLVFKWYVNKVLMMFQESLKGVSRVFQVKFKGIPRKFQGC